MFYTYKEEATSLLAIVRGVDKSSPGTGSKPVRHAVLGEAFLFKTELTVTPSPPDKEHSQSTRQEPIQSLGPPFSWEFNPVN